MFYRVLGEPYTAKWSPRSLAIWGLRGPHITSDLGPGGPHIAGVPISRLYRFDGSGLRRVHFIAPIATLSIEPYFQLWLSREYSITRDTHCANDLAPRTSAFALVFPKYAFYVPNPCILGTRPVLPCKNGSCCKLELVGTKSVFVLCYSRYLSVVGCSQVELSYQ